MAKVLGRVVNENRDGFTSGLVGDYPIDEAFKIVREGRISFDYPDAPALSGLSIPELLAGLEVGSIAELAALVERARAFPKPGSAREFLEQLGRDCEYNEEEDGSVDDLIDYKNALEEALGTLIETGRLG